MNLKIQKLLQKFNELGTEAILLSSAYNRRYISGFTGSSAYLYISPSRQILLTDFRYITQATAQCPDFQVVDYRKAGLIETLEEYLKADEVKNCGFEGNQMTFAEYRLFVEKLPWIEWKTIGNAVEELRMIKTPEELALLRQASKIGDDAFTHMLNYIKPGMSEKQIALELEFTMRKLGAEGLSFDSIIASGVNGALPHARPSDKLIQTGELLTMDFGCIYQGYCSDMTRTVAIGEVSDKLKEIYEVVYRAHMESLAALRPGVAGKEIDAVARNIIAEAGYGDYFGHGLGHSVGLEVHEAPGLSAREDRILEANMLETIEPGIYIEGLGGVRIEDLAVLTENGADSLVTSEKKLIVL